MMRRLVGAVGAAVMVVTTATGCLLSPDDADVDDFCAAAETFFLSSNEKEFVEAQKALADVGTPEEIAGAERRGFKYLMELEWAERENGRRDNEKADIAAFVAARVRVCGK